MESETTTKSLYTNYNLLKLDLLPLGWDQQILAVAEKFATFVHLDGGNPDSFEPEGSDGTDYYVVTGDIACQHLPWLLDLYRLPLKDLASQAVKSPLTAAVEIRHGVNINVLKGKAHYEWHVDPNPVSGVLYVTTHLAHQGGGLVLRQGSKETTIQPQAGDFLVFEGGVIPHSVAPLLYEQTRISIPLLFYFEGQEQIWPAGLESYLYGR